MIVELPSNPAAGLDWPVRILVYRPEKDDVRILHRHGITDRDEGNRVHYIDR
jgi:uncharacterized protein (DUF302 family)